MLLLAEAGLLVMSSGASSNSKPGKNGTPGICLGDFTGKIEFKQIFGKKHGDPNMLYDDL